jgi:transposase
VGRAIGLDVHRDFCEVAIVEGGALRSAGRIATTPERLELFASSLAPSDRVALEVTGSAWEIARILEPHVARVVVVSPADTGIRQARAKTDRLDARTLARLLAAGELDAVWSPDQQTRVLRRRLARRAQLVRARTRAKNEIHAVLVRRLVARPPVSDLFGVKGRAWLAGLELPLEEAETVAACLRHVGFLDAEIAAVEREIARQALASPELRRLLTVPGVNVICAATFLAAVGDIRRFPTARKLVGYLGLDPRVYQSGSAPATGGRISKQGSPAARWALVEAARSAVQQPGPLRAFYERIRGRRGGKIAVVAVARKLAVLFWSLLSARRGLRPPAALADGQEAAPARDPRRRADAEGHADRDLGDPASRCARPSASSAGRPRPPTSGSSPTGRPRQRSGRERDSGAHMIRPAKGNVARQARELQTPALRHVIDSRPQTT